jgi:squalene-hopene/tetraprenyl-beta-curcumene cyclase
MLERFADSDGLGAIFPPIIWSVIALRCLGYAEDSDEVQECLSQLEALIIEEDDTVRLQPCKSPVWDTAITLRALSAVDDVAEDSLVRCIDWLLAKEVRVPGDWTATVNAEPAGWFFEHRNAFYPDIDDTIMVMMALREVNCRGEANASPLVERCRTRVNAACQRGLQWVLAMQNSDGGWGAFDKDNDLEILCHVPFADHNAMIDPSTPDITARVLETISQLNVVVGDPAVDRAVAYIRRTQEDDGAWFGRWGVNYIYGTWQVLSGLARAGVPVDDDAIQRGVAWLLKHQQPDGGWGESARTYDEPETRGVGPVTASQTAWALLGLLDAGCADHSAVAQGVRYLLDRQQPDGSWNETEFTGTGFPRVFYLRYHMYPMYFPLLALARWRQSQTKTHPS